MLAGKIGLAGGLLAWLALGERLQLGRLAAVPLSWQLVTLLALVAGSMSIPALRWWWLLRIQGLPEPLGRVVKLTWAGYLAALVLPGTASGDLAKSWLILRQHNQTRARAFSTVVADRFLGLHSLFCLGALSSIWIAWQDSMAGVAMAAAILAPLTAMTIGLTALLYRPTRRLLFRVFPATWRDSWEESFALYHAGVCQVLGCFALSLLSSSMTVASLAMAGRLLGRAVAWDAAFIASPLIVVANCLPITPGGLGLAEATSSELFTHMGFAGGAELMLLTRICAALVSLPGILPLLASLNTRQEPDSEELASANGGGIVIFSKSLLTSHSPPRAQSE